MTRALRFLDRRILVSDSTPLKVEKEPGVLAVMEARNVQPGMRVLIEREYVNTIPVGGRPIETIEEALAQLPVYRAVRGTIFEQREGSETTTLRASLIRSFAQQAQVNPTDLEARIFAPDGITQLEYTALASSIHRTLAAAHPSPVKEETIRSGWLGASGKSTYFPRDWYHLEALGNTPLAKYFESFRTFPERRAKLTQVTDFISALNLDTRTPDLFGAYLLFVGMRQVEGRLAARPGMRTSTQRMEAEKTDGADSLYNYRDITAHVAKHFLEDIGTEHKLGLLLDVQQTESAPGTSPKRPEFNFSRGVHQGAELPPNTGYKLMSFDRVWEDSIILREAHNTWTWRIITQRADKEPGVYDSAIVALVYDDVRSRYMCSNGGAKREISRRVGTLGLQKRELYTRLRENVAVSMDKVPDGAGITYKELYQRLRRHLVEANSYLPSQSGAMYDLVFLMRGERHYPGSNLSNAQKKAYAQTEKQLRATLNRKYRFHETRSLPSELEAEVFREAEQAVKNGMLNPLVDLQAFIFRSTSDAIRRSPRGVIRYHEIQQRLDDFSLGPLIDLFDKKLYARYGML